MATPKLVQRTPEWREARRSLVTSTDLPVILGLSPYRSEGDLAREKLGTGPAQEENLPMRLGAALEPLIKSEYERATGSRLNRVHGIAIHPTMKWAAASPDWRVVGQRRLVEGKWTQARKWDEEEVPQDVEAQVRWAMGVTGFPAADVAAIVHGREFRVVGLEHDPEVFDGLVIIAEDFRRRLADGGPFRETKESLKSLYPQDDGETMAADEEVAEWVTAYLGLRGQLEKTQEDMDALEEAIKKHMGATARVQGPGWNVRWKRNKDGEETNWRGLAEGLLKTVPEEDRATLIGLHTMFKAGARPFYVAFEKGRK